MHFGDFLKYSKNALIGQKPQVEIITSEQKATFQNPTILMTTQSDHGLTIGYLNLGSQRCCLSWFRWRIS